MDYVTYHVCQPEEREVQEFKESLCTMAPISWVICFESDRWRYVEYVILAKSKADGRSVGMATLAPCNEDGRDGPEIIGVWVHPSVRTKGIGMGLVKEAIAQAKSVYTQPVSIEACSQQGYGLVEAVEREGLCAVRFLPGTETFILP